MALPWVLMLGLVNAAWAGSVLRNGATFVSQTPPPAVMTPGQTFRVEVRMRNSGRSTWTSAAGFKLGAQDPADNANWRLGRLAVPNTVAPGQEGVFAFDIRAPQAPGEYRFKWRMVREKVEWFGFFTADAAVRVSSPTPVPDPTPVLGPNPSPGAWNGVVPNLGSVVDDVAGRYPDLFARSCQTAAGGSWEFMDKVVTELRARDRRFGFNCKRGNCGDPSKDGVAYYAGSGDPADGKGPVVWIDTIVAHCGDSRPSWQVFPFDNAGYWISHH